MGTRYAVGLTLIIAIALGIYIIYKYAFQTSKLPVDKIMGIEQLELYRGGDMRGETTVKLNWGKFTKTINTYSEGGITNTATGTLAGQAALLSSLQKHNYRQLKSDPTRGPDMVFSTIDAKINGKPYKLYCVSSPECQALTNELFAIFDEALQENKGIQ